MSDTNQEWNDSNDGDAENLETPSVASVPKITTITYVCGECHSDTDLSAKDMVRCRECGFRILYKKKTSRIVVYDGR